MEKIAELLITWMPGVTCPATNWNAAQMSFSLFLSTSSPRENV
jgi:hypothetical protein